MSPDSMTKSQFADLLKAVFQASGNGAGGPKRSRVNDLIKFSVWDEKHADGSLHRHFPMLAAEPWYFLPLVKGLREKGIYVHMSGEHSYYWTAVVYLAILGSGHDGKTDVDDNPWLSPNHLDVRATLAGMPPGARASDKAKARRYLGLDDAN